MIAVLTMLSPVWLAGLSAAVGLPVAAHLLSRTRYVPTLFPGTRFVTQAVLETNQVDRPRHLMLLVLRVLVLALVALAFARPQWTAGSTAIPPTEQGVAVVFVIDASASMQRTERGRSYFDQALAAADTQLGSLNPAQDTAAVILADRLPRLLLPEPTARFSLLRDRLTDATCTQETADLAGAVALARAVLVQQGRAGRIIVLSDGQRSGHDPRAMLAAAEGVPLEEYRVGEAMPANVSVRLVDATPYPPALASEFVLTVELQNHSRESRTETLVAEGGGGRTTLRVDLAPGAVTTQTLAVKPTTAGVAVFRVGLAGGDAFPLDDATGLVAEVAPARRVVLMSDEARGGRPLDRAASRIDLALRPDAGKPGAVRVVRWAPGDAPGTEPTQDSSACWVLAGVTRFEPLLLDAIGNHLRAGGGVVWFADSQLSRDALSVFDGVPMHFIAEPARDATIAAVRFDHPALAVFEGPARGALVGTRVAGVASGRPSGDAQVLASAQDGRPIIVSTTVGRGRLVVVNADIAPGRSDFATQPAFVPLVSELVRFAAPGPGLPPRLHPGDRLPGVVLDSATFDAPDGFDPASGRAASIGPHLATNTAGEPIAGRWVALDPGESDSRLAPALGTATGDPATAAAPTAAGSSFTGPAVTDLWPFCIAGALLLIGFESLALIGFARREASA